MAKKRVIPLELKYDFFMRAYISTFKGLLYTVRKEFDASTSLRVYETFCTMGDRIKNLTILCLVSSNRLYTL